MITTTMIIIGVAIAILLAVAIASQRSGPRVTQIETHRASKDRKDGDDA